MEMRSLHVKLKSIFSMDFFFLLFFYQTVISPFYLHTYSSYKLCVKCVILKFSDVDPVSGSESGSGALGPDLWKIFKIPLNEFSIGNLLVSFFCIFYFLGQTFHFDVLNPKNKPGSGSRALGLTEDVWHQKYENKKEVLQNYIEYSFKSILNIFYRSGYRALDPKFGQNRNHIPAKIPNLGHVTL